MLDRLKPLAPYIRRYRKSLAWGCVALILYNTLKAMVPIVVGHAVDDLRVGITREKILLHALRLLGLAAASGVFLYITRQVIIGVSREIEFDLRNDLFANLERQSASVLPDAPDRRHHGAVDERSIAVRQLLGPAIMYSLNTVFFTVAALPVMIRLSPRLMLFAFVPLPVASVLVQ